jgi:hypothetical protein
MSGWRRGLEFDQKGQGGWPGVANAALGIAGKAEGRRESLCRATAQHPSSSAFTTFFDSIANQS